MAKSVSNDRLGQDPYFPDIRDNCAYLSVIGFLKIL